MCEHVNCIFRTGTMANHNHIAIVTTMYFALYADTNLTKYWFYESLVMLETANRGLFLAYISFASSSLEHTMVFYPYNESELFHWVERRRATKMKCSAILRIHFVQKFLFSHSMHYIIRFILKKHAKRNRVVVELWTLQQEIFLSPAKGEREKINNEMKWEMWIMRLRSISSSLWQTSDKEDFTRNGRIIIEMPLLPTISFVTNRGEMCLLIFLLSRITKITLWLLLNQIFRIAVRHRQHSSQV